MEKVCLAWWRREDEPPDLLLGRLLPLLQALPALRGATVHVESAEHPVLRHGSGADGTVLTGLASLWWDSYQDLPDLPVGLIGHAWLVCESVPQPYGEARTWPLGERSPGLTLVTLLDKPGAVTEPEFYRCWHQLHRATTAECHPFSSYVRNEVARPLTAGAPPLRGIVTESAPDVADFLDPHRFYRSGGDEPTLREHQRRVFGEVVQFIDMDTIQVAPMSEYVLQPLAATSP